MFGWASTNLIKCRNLHLKNCQKYFLYSCYSVLYDAMKVLDVCSNAHTVLIILLSKLFHTNKRYYVCRLTIVLLPCQSKNTNRMYGLSIWRKATWQNKRHFSLLSFLMSILLPCFLGFTSEIGLKVANRCLLWQE